RGDLAAAEHRLDELARQFSDAAAVHVALGEVRARRGDDEGAVSAFGRAVDRSSASIDGWLGLGQALARLGRPDPAREALRRVLLTATDDSRRARAHAARGLLAARAGAVGRAIREFRKAAELAPDDLTIAADLGRQLS